MCTNSFEELNIIIKLKTKYLQHSIISRIKRQFINSFDDSEVLIQTVIKNVNEL